MVSNEALAAVVAIVGVLFLILLYVLQRLDTSITALGDCIADKVSKDSCRDIRSDCFKTCPIRQNPRFKEL